MLFIDDFESEKMQTPNRGVFDAFALFPYPAITFKKKYEGSPLLLEKIKLRINDSAFSHFYIIK